MNPTRPWVLVMSVPLLKGKGDRESTPAPQTALTQQAVAETAFQHGPIWFRCALPWTQNPCSWNGLPVSARAPQPV